MRRVSQVPEEEEEDSAQDSEQSAQRPESSAPSTITTQTLGRLMDDNERQLYRAKLAQARKSGQLNANLKAEIQMHEDKSIMRSRMNPNPLRRAEVTQEHDLVLGESALEIINMFKVKAEESRQRIHQLKQEVLNAQALTAKYKELYERTRKQQLRDGDNEDDSKSASAPEHLYSNAPPMAASVASSASAGNGTIASLRKRSVNFELEYERLQIKHQASLHEIERLKADIQRLKNDNQRLISQVRTAEEDQREALNKYAASETARLTLEKRLEREKKQHQILFQTVKKQTADWLSEHRQQQLLEEEDKWNSIIPSDDRHILRPKEKRPKEAVSEDTQTPARDHGSVVSHLTGSNRGSEKSNVNRSNLTSSVGQRKA